MLLLRSTDEESQALGKAALSELVKDTMVFDYTMNKKKYTVTFYTQCDDTFKVDYLNKVIGLWHKK